MVWKVLAVIGLMCFFLCLGLCIKTFKVPKRAVEEAATYRFAFYHRFFKNLQFEKIRRLLKEAEEPMSLELYVFVHGFIGVVIIVEVVHQMILLDFARAAQQVVTILLVSAVPVNGYIFFRKTSRDKVLKLQLGRIQEIIYYQSKIGTPDAKIFALLSQRVNPPFKKAFIKIAAAYDLKGDVAKAINELSEISSIPEIITFQSILAAKEKTGRSDANLKSYNATIKRFKQLMYRLYFEVQMEKILMAAFVLGISLLLIIAIPMIKEAFIGFNKTFS